MDIRCPECGGTIYVYANETGPSWATVIEVSIWCDNCDAHWDRNGTRIVD